MKARDQKETLQVAPQADSGTRTPLLWTDGAARFVKNGESRECFYFGVARKLIGDQWSLLKTPS